MKIDLVQYSDIPLTEEYLNKMAKNGVEAVNQSKWLNAISAEITDEQKEWLLKQDFVKEVIPIQRRVTALANYNGQVEDDERPENASYSTAISQMEAELMKKEGLTGEGIVIGVIDAGYYGLTKNRNLKHLLKDERILGTRDFVDPSREDLFNNMVTYSDDHGNTVVEHIAGIRSKGPQYGFAIDASFYLTRSEKGDTETRAEEDYWISAMEWLDSLGVRIINTSLGYAIGFDDPKQNYKLKEMDGNTAVITKAAQIATEEKGLLLVVSAGNEGNDSNWQIVSAPADAKGVLSVGAVGPTGLKAGYSSIGPDFLPYLKPNVSCFSLMGTSFSAPVITGFAACLLQRKPEATGEEIKEIIEMSGSLYPNGNNFLGYGVPKASKALKILEGKKLEAAINKRMATGKDEYTVKASEKDIEEAIVFHKRKQHYVTQQELVKGTKGKFKVVKPAGVTESTFVCGDEVLEIIW
ncbi:MAG: peptidase S8 [Thalassobius sp.]|nr:peptidase S8 [Thalassovita sp.]